VADTAHPFTTSFDPHALVGAVLDDRYELLAHLATGGMGAVFQARHVHLRKDVAVKVLRSELSSTPDIVERFRREAEIASALEHDNIVRVTDFGRSQDGHLYLVMELLHGESLFDRLRRDGFLAPEDAVSILWQICAGLEAAHARGVVHRDLKPENVFLARTASGREVTKILDFGICKITDPEAGSATQAGIVVGTPEYLAPEQATGGAVDARADLYTVGLIAWRMLAGRHPFKADDARGLLMMQATQPVPPLTGPRPDLAAWPGLVSAIARACAKAAAERHPTAAALRDDLAAALGPAFMAPPGATPAPPLALSPVPLRTLSRPRPELEPLPSRDGGAATAAVSPAAFSWSLARAMRRARMRIATRRLWRDALNRAGDAMARVRARPRLAAAAAALVLALAAAPPVLAWYQGRASAEIRRLLGAGKVTEARARADDALRRRPGDPELLLLRARALQRTAGQAAASVDAWATVLERSPVEREALEALADSLGRDRAVADRAARVLRDAGSAAVPAVASLAEKGRSAERLRALQLLRDLGAEEQVDRVKLYGALLADPDCELRRTAAERLGEIGEPAALPRLREAAAATVEKHGFLGRTSREPACAAAEAEAAVKRIQAAH
jgi:eukaryotic-like serine/threonine-protein kinase